MAQTEETQQAPQVHFTFRRSNDYRIVHVTGAWGGVTPQGRIKFDLYTEFGKVPSEETRPIKEDGSLGEPLESKEDSETFEAVRELQVGVVISAEDAESVAQWLMEKAQQVRQRREDGED